MNEEQRRKAEEIVKNSTVKEIEKKYALYMHLDTVEEVNKYQLPYKVLIDHKKNEIGKGYAPLCDTYPLPGYPKDKRPMFNYPNDYNDNEPKYYGADSDKLKDDKKQILDTFINEYVKDFNDTQVYDYYLLHLLQGYDIDSFTVFDFYGENKEVSQAELNLLKNVYKRKQKQFTDNPGAYLQNEPTYTQKERRQYTYSTHLVKYDDEIITDYINGLSESMKKYNTDLPNVLANGQSLEIDL